MSHNSFKVRQPSHPALRYQIQKSSVKVQTFTELDESVPVSMGTDNIFMALAVDTDHINAFGKFSSILRTTALIEKTAV